MPDDVPANGHEREGCHDEAGRKAEISGEPSAANGLGSEALDGLLGKSKCAQASVGAHCATSWRLGLARLADTAPAMDANGDRFGIGMTGTFHCYELS